MKDINAYIIEKLRINNNTKLAKLLDLDETYLMVHKTHIKGEVYVYIENIVNILSVDEEDEHLILTEPEIGGEYRYHYIIINDHVVLAEGEWSYDMVVLLPKYEAIEFLKDLPKNDYNIDLKKYFGEGGKAAVRNDNEERKINDSQIKNKLNELK